MSVSRGERERDRERDKETEKDRESKEGQRTEETFCAHG
jgi:hypothetical protein